MENESIEGLPVEEKLVIPEQNLPPQLPENEADKIAITKRTDPKASKTLAKKLEKAIKEKPPKAEKPKADWENRTGITTFFSPEEMAHLQPIIEARIAAGHTKDRSHFIRQAVDFAINFVPVVKPKKSEIQFGVPDGTKEYFLKNGFFQS